MAYSRYQVKAALMYGKEKTRQISQPKDCLFLLQNCIFPFKMDATENKECTGTGIKAPRGNPAPSTRCQPRAPRFLQGGPGKAGPSSTYLRPKKKNHPASPHRRSAIAQRQPSSSSCGDEKSRGANAACCAANAKRLRAGPPSPQPWSRARASQPQNPVSVPVLVPVPVPTPHGPSTAAAPNPTRPAPGRAVGPAARGGATGRWRSAALSGLPGVWGRCLGW